MFTLFFQNKAQIEVRLRESRSFLGNGRELLLGLRKAPLPHQFRSFSELVVYASRLTLRNQPARWRQQKAQPRKDADNAVPARRDFSGLPHASIVYLGPPGPGGAQTPGVETPLTPKGERGVFT